MKNKSILISIVVLAILACVVAVWKLYSSAPNEAAAIHTSHYTVKNGKVYWEEYLHVGAEGTPSEWRLNESEIAGADAATFKAVSLKKGVNLEADVDPQISAAENSIWGKDKENIFLQGQKMPRLEGTTTPTIDTATFETLGGIFVRDAQGVYEVQNGYYWLIPGVDPKTFVVVNSQYAKDAHAVYYIQNNGSTYDVLPIADLDPSTFRVIGVCGGAETYQSYAVADAHSVYAVDQAVPAADPATFTIVGLVVNNPDGLSSETGYAKDKNHVYKSCSEVVPGVNPAQCTADNLKGCEAK
jgi:hypothetical protein